MILLRRLSKGNKTLSRRGYTIIIGGLWVYTILWCALLAYLWFNWDTTVLLHKIVLTILLIIGTPAITDLFQSYEQYTKERASSGEAKQA